MNEQQKAQKSSFLQLVQQGFGDDAMATIDGLKHNAHLGPVKSLDSRDALRYAPSLQE